ncbi:unnamed protein product [Rotaria sp. Silwood2]|nr:unnamed protein product [Rotaria sp. Silwood2]CAF4199096.1 unnamed protein product [Rotaria sp. Silwood2]
MVDVFYSLVDVNRRFHRLVFDSLYIRHLDMTTIMNVNSVYDQSSSIDIEVLSEICEKILPRIDHQVHKLTIEQDSMKQILTTNYPQLYSLSLINFQEEILYQELTDNLVLRDFLSKQITHLNIDIKKTRDICSKTVANIFASILFLCKKLIVLNFGDMSARRKCKTPVFYIGSQINMSSTLMKLKINVVNFADCLYLLDGRFECLSTLIINVLSIFDQIGNIGGRKKLPKLKCFSLSTFGRTYAYDSLIVPLLCRMINLEELQLYLVVVRTDATYIDGIQLYDQFLIYMTQLKKFTFNIKTNVRCRNVRVELPSNQDIQRSFIGRDYQQVASCISTEDNAWDGECRICSLPYDFEYYFDLENSFQGGMFDKVRRLTMADRIPIKYKLFQLISHDFRYLEFLSIPNDYPMKDKQRSSTLIKFLFLTFLDLKGAHMDYAELFLVRKNTNLPRLSNLSVEYKSLTKITNNFTSDAIHFNFGTVKSLDVHQSFVHPENFHHYFPLL